MRGRRFKTQADIDRYIKQGYGQGEGIDYKPWLRVRDVPSKGRSHIVPGSKIDRAYHFLSDIEFYYFLSLEFSEQILDIREQYPILEIEQTKAIATSLGIKYPNYPGTNVPFIFSTDFLVTYQGDDGLPHLAARSVKDETALEPSESLEWTLLKLEIERIYWKSKGISWLLVTNKTINPIISHNLTWLRSGIRLDRQLHDKKLHQLFIETFAHLNGSDRKLQSMIKSTSTAIHLNYKDGVLLFKHLVWNKAIRLNFSETCLDLAMKAPKFELFATSICPDQGVS
ncbi:TnsA endonuclease N-terminal domain-containing protein [Deefgea sp. CFH1-16]|uniref:TnsA endonuclease N-terminal domain-containing protein n=1 Tax=Deefgea sp. CFH1-16 TaxID=2675457 RepID=UPI0015F54A55|nr:TnsA endonuclease N-terminal domain-containing protein [Deefgea sp. CFH1-16]MBM5573354.1 heteromeric transposase endonuclease subunit TnsA [Deefgea sp. CFH1-16]